MALGSKYVKGIEIEIGGNSTKLKTALDSANRSIKTTQTELDTLRNSLKLEWNSENFSRTQQLAQRALQQTQDKAETLKKALAELDKQGESKNVEQYEAIRRELSYVQVEAQKAQKRLEEVNNIKLDNLRKSLQEAGTSLDSAGNRLSAGVTAPLMAAGAAAVKFASDTAESVNKVEVAFGSAAGSVQTWANTTLNSIGLAKGTALDMAALYGDMATSMGAADDQAAAMSTTLVNLAADLASFKNISIDQAGTALKAIFTGETETLKNLGVVMTEANLKAYALAEGYSTAYDSMDQLEKVQLRYQYVLAQTQNAQGDFARTFDGTANQLRVCQESLKELAATAGEELLPIVTPIITQVNGLLQSFGDLDEVTRKNVTQALLFAATLGPMLKLVGMGTTVVSGAVTAYGALTTALRAKQAADIAATASQTGLNAAMAANPVTAVITVIGSLIAILGSYALTAALTAEKTETLTDKLNESRQAYEDTKQAIADENTKTQDMVTALAQLAETEDKTSAQKETMLSLVGQLNEAVPNLSLAYDAQTDSLNLSTAAIRAYAQAMADQEERQEAVTRLTELYQDQAAIADELATATRDLEEAQARKDEMVQNGTMWTQEYWQASAEVNDSLVTAQKRFEDVTKAQGLNNAEIVELETAYNGLQRSAEQTAESISNSGNAAKETTSSMEILKGVIADTKDGYQLLAKAQGEAADSGYLTLDTVEKLISSGLEDYLEEVEGGYRLANGALEDYMDAQKAEYTTALGKAKAAAVALITQNSDEVASIDETTDAIRRKIEALQAEARVKMNAHFAELASSNDFANKGEAYMRQVTENDLTIKYLRGVESSAANALLQLDAAEKKLGALDRAGATLARDYGTKTSGKSSGKTSEKEQSQAEKDLEDYKSAVAELDHQRAMDEISEREYYTRKGEYANRYLTENADERKKWDEELHAWQKGAYDRDLTELKEALENEKITREEYLDGLNTLQEQYFEEGTDEWLAAERQRQKEIAQYNQDAYDDQRADLDYFHRMGLYDDQQYYTELARLRDSYLEQDSAAWRSATLELHDWIEDQRKAELEAAEKAYQDQLKALQEALDAELDALKDGYEARKAAAKEAYQAQKDAAKQAYDARKQQIKDELAAEKNRLNAIIAGIDAEIQARKELREDEDQDAVIAAAQKRLTAAKAQLEFARTNEDRAQWEKEVLRLQEALEEAIRDKEDTAFYREKEAEKDAVREQISAAEDAADKALTEAESNYNAKVAQLEAEYQATLKRLEAEYQAAVSRLESKYASKGESSSGGGGKTYSDEVRAIARAHDVDLGVAQDMYNNDQRHKGEDGYTPYASAAKSAADSMARAVGAVADTVTRAVTQTTTNITRNAAANVTINEASSLTSGQISAAVQKTLDKLSR